MPDQNTPNSYALEMRGITKRFPGVLANDNVVLQLRRGEIRALVGENGAGKSTLMKILYGLYQPDSGEIFLHGQRMVFRSPLDAIQAGLGMVHQHFMLFPSLSVYENVIYGAEPTQAGGFISRRAARAKVQSLAEQYGLAVNPNAKVSELPVGMRQRVEILKTLYRNADVLILDEPTAVLTPQEEEELFRVLRRLADGGKTLIFITHKLNEVMQISDNATVLRDGKVVTTLETKDTSPAEISRAMVGRDVMLRVNKTAQAAGANDVVLAVDDLHVANNLGQAAVHGVAFHVHKGEIVGIAGVAGNGQNELVEAVAGLRSIQSGTVQLLGRDVTNANVATRRGIGMAYIPEDRGGVGLALGARVSENLLMARQRANEFGGRGWLRGAAIKARAEKLIRQYVIKTNNTTGAETTANLSGGNRQKAVVARELSHNAPLLIAEQPTWGVDVGSIEFIHQQLLDYRQRGHAVLLISADLGEVMALADRILVMFEGRVAGEVRGSAATEQGLGLLMMGASNSQ